VRTKIVVCDECGCWRWTGSRDSSQYAKLKLRGKTLILHRYVYEALVGEIPDGMTIDHLNCTLRWCVNPAHMQVVSALDNTLRANATRWHDVKFDDTGNATDRRHCKSCASFKAVAVHPDPVWLPNVARSRNVGS
jgi:hypothetical protein